MLVTKYSHTCTTCWGSIPAKTRVRALTEVNNETRQVMTFYFCQPCCAAMLDVDGLDFEKRVHIGIRRARRRAS